MMQNRKIQDVTDSRPLAGTAGQVPLWKIRAIIRKLRARAEVLDQRINELEWTSQLNRQSSLRKPAKCRTPAILHRDTASIAGICDRFLPKKRTVI